jgi:hypothetical protein
MSPESLDFNGSCPFVTLQGRLSKDKQTYLFTAARASTHKTTKAPARIKIRETMISGRSWLLPRMGKRSRLACHHTRKWLPVTRGLTRAALILDFLLLVSCHHDYRGFPKGIIRVFIQHNIPPSAHEPGSRLIFVMRTRGIRFQPSARAAPELSAFSAVALCRSEM